MAMEGLNALEAFKGGSAMTSRARGPSTGFSLVEIMIVITIIAIVSATAIPYGLNFVKNYKITGAAQGVVAEIQRARAQAVKRNTGRGILLNFNYPQAEAYQFTSLDPNPMTGNWDGGVYPPVNPGYCNSNSVIPTNYGTVPDPPNNIVDPDRAAGMQSPHGIPIDLPQDIAFEDGDRNALLFCADGSVVAVNAAGAVGGAVLSQAENGVDWLLTIRDRTTQLERIIRVSPRGRVRVEQQ
jgi:prepilin-type N-terminal cleavage/methylation domain-containing protein